MHCTSLQRQRGFSLIELMVATMIGIVLVAGALTVHIQSHDAQQFTERMSRIQENGRFALDMIAPDIRLAGFWARTENAASISRRTGDPANPMPNVLTPDDDCYAGFWTNVLLEVEAANETQVGANNPFAGCLDDAARLAGSDVLVVRRAAADPADPADLTVGQLYMISNMVNAELFVAGAQPVPSGFAAGDPIHQIITHVYYLSPNSSLGAGVPSLNRMELTAGPDYAIRELITGLEDFQVQFGIDSDADGSVNSYLTPGDPALAGAAIGAVRVWVRVRAEAEELGYTDEATWEYADLSMQPDDRFRRMLLTKTIQFRNGRGSIL